MSQILCLDDSVHAFSGVPVSYVFMIEFMFCEEKENLAYSTFLFLTQNSSPSIDCLGLLRLLWVGF